MTFGVARCSSDGNSPYQAAQIIGTREWEALGGKHNLTDERIRDRLEKGSDGGEVKQGKMPEKAPGHLKARPLCAHRPAHQLSFPLAPTHLQADDIKDIEEHNKQRCAAARALSRMKTGSWAWG